MEPNNSDPAFNELNKELCRVGVFESAEVSIKAQTREALSDSYGTLSKSRAPPNPTRVSSPIQNKRILPGWTRRPRENTNVIPSEGQGQKISGQKRTVESAEEEFGLPAKRIQALLDDVQTNLILAEADS